MAVGRLDVAILCPGPSLAGRALELREHDCLIGVNRAASQMRCDWWVFGDPEAFDGWRPLIRLDRSLKNVAWPRIFSSRSALERIKKRDRLANWPAPLYYEDINTECPSRPDWRQFSVTAALVLAEHLGAFRITLYGCDWVGDRDSCGELQSSYRWQNEQHAFSRVSGSLGDRGIHVGRHIRTTKPDDGARDSTAAVGAV